MSRIRQNSITAIEATHRIQKSSMSQDSRHIVFSDYVNAWSIRRGLKQLGKRLHHAVPGDTTAGVPRAGDVLYFTDERSLQQFLPRNELQFLPRSSGLVIDDKLWFYDWLSAFGEQTIPYSGDLNSPRVWPALIKARHSWKGDRKLPRGFVCHTTLEFQHARQQLPRLGLSESDFCTQQFLPSCSFVYSVCGHFDSQDNQRNAILVTRKTLTCDQDLGTGAVVDTVADPQDLLRRTARILNALRYQGPFELEFLHDPNTQTYYVLELNPRFWMQHGIFIDGFENILIKRYLGIDDGVPQKPQPDQAICWLCRVDLVTAVLKCDYRLVSRFVGLWWNRRRRGVRCLWCPDWRTTIRYVFRICRQKLRHRQADAAVTPVTDSEIAAAA